MNGAMQISLNRPKINIIPLVSSFPPSISCLALDRGQPASCRFRQGWELQFVGIATIAVARSLLLLLESGSSVSGSEPIWYEEATLISDVGGGSFKRGSEIARCHGPDFSIDLTLSCSTFDVLIAGVYYSVPSV